MIKLYDYIRSTASYRVRTALAYKGLDYQALPVHLVNNGGEHLQESYQKINPQSLVPSLSDDQHIITQSLAIIDYLEETHPRPSLYPNNPLDKATVKSLSLSIACDIHPLNNLRVLNYLSQKLKVSDKEKTEWYHHWIHLGFKAIESRLHDITRVKPVCFGDSITVADLCLIPQVFNANRFDVPLDNYPLITEINDYCLTLNCFKASKPE